MLMLRWEAARQQGIELSLAALCADCPQLMEGSVNVRCRDATCLFKGGVVNP
jgi:hypothetical protein